MPTPSKNGRAPAEHPVTAYARAVISREIVAGQLVRKACERHLRDLVHGHERGLRFDAAAADRALGFFAFLRHSKGEWAGKQIVLEPWQQFIVGSLFGWKRTDGTRRFRTSYCEIARKNGKTTLLAGIGLYLAFFDGEGGAEVYAAATKRDQAKICWGEARRMVLATPQLRQRITPLVANLHSTATNSKFEPLGADADSMDGLNIHGAIVDELHAHKTRAIVDVLETATGARRQPLINYITTAGVDRHSVCWEQHDYGIKLLDQVLDDDTFFVFIATIDPEDSWSDEAVWPKANPNLHVSVKLDDLRRKCERAIQVPGQQNAFKRLHLNVWTEQVDRWIDVGLWDEAEPPRELEDLVGQACFGGLDLSSTTDISALVLLFPDEDSAYDVVCQFWVPEERLRQRAERDRVPYDVWAAQGWIKPTSGNVIDYDEIRAFLQTDVAERFGLVELAYDRWNATQLITQLQGDGLTVVPFGQGFASMSAPAKHFEALVLGKQLRHGGNPVLRWMVANVAAEQDAAGNLKPSKAKSTERIDGVVALIMALGRAIVAPEDEGRSTYEDESLFVLD